MTEDGRLDFISSTTRISLRNRDQSPEFQTEGTLKDSRIATLHVKSVALGPAKAVSESFVYS